MKKLFFIILLPICIASVSSCRSGYKGFVHEFGATSTGNQISVEEVSRHEYEEVISDYHNSFVFDTIRYKKINGTISIPLENGAFKIFMDSSGDNQRVWYKYYKYAGFNDKLKCIFVVGIFEGKFMVDLKTGHCDTLIGYPYFSDDLSRMITFNGGGGDHPYVDVWESTRDSVFKWKKIGGSGSDVLWIKECAWSGNNSFYLESWDHYFFKYTIHKQ